MKRAQKIALSSTAFIAFSLASTLLGACVAEDDGIVDRVDRLAQASTEKVEVCHYTTSDSNPYVIIVIGETAVTEHLAHGDTLGACGAPDAAPPLPPPPPPPVDAAPAGEPDAEVLPG